jgi:hypothetical protein
MYGKMPMKAIGSEIRQIARTNICLYGNDGGCSSGLAMECRDNGEPLALVNEFLVMVNLLSHDYDNIKVRCSGNQWKLEHSNLW